MQISYHIFLNVLAILYSNDTKKWLQECNSPIICKIKGVLVLCLITILILHISSFTFLDYKLWGCYTPAIISLCHWNKELPKHLKRYDNLFAKICLLAIALFLVCTMTNQYQAYSFFALIPLCFYSGERKNIIPKNFFYIYYPLHMIALFLLSQI